MKRVPVDYEVYRVVVCECGEKILFRQLLAPDTHIACKKCKRRMVIRGRAPQYVKGKG
jgi:DNA-directed RNA polymerase subunit RPC12/RpoP